MTVLDVARTVIDLCGSNSEIRFLPMRDGEPEFSKVVAESPQCDRLFPFGMSETIDYYKEKLGL
jgi:hypothetical protein